jgi:cyclohexadienyl dehydratase
MNMPTSHRFSGIGFSACAVVLMLLTSTSPAHAEESVLDAIKQRGELRVAGLLYRPFIARRPSGEYVGVDVDVMTKMAKDLGVKIMFVDAEWSTAVAGIASKKWDIMPGACITPKRLEVIDFSESYLTVGGTLVFLKSNPKNFKSVADFDKPDVVFAVPAGSWSEQIAKVVVPHATLKPFGQSASSELLQEVLAGRSDAIVLDTPVGTSVSVARYPDQLGYIPSATKALDALPCPLGYGYLKGDKKLGDYLNAYIEKEKASGALDALFHKWMLPEYITPTK